MGWLIVLWIFLALIAILTLVLFLPVGIRLRYGQEGFKLWCAIGPVRFRLPLSKASKSQEKEKNKPVSDESNIGNRKHDNVLGNFRADLKTILQIFGYLRPRLHIKRLVLKLHLAGQSPATLAIYYGSAWAAIGGLLPLLEEAFILEKRELDVDCDFSGDATTLDANLDISIGLGRLLRCLFRYGFNTLDKQKETH